MTDNEQIKNIDVLLSAITRHCKEANETAKHFEQKEALLQVLNAIQQSATVLMQRTINDESACDAEMLAQYLNEVLAKLVKAEDAQRGRCLRGLLSEVGLLLFCKMEGSNK